MNSSSAIIWISVLLTGPAHLCLAFQRLAHLAQTCVDPGYFITPGEFGSHLVLGEVLPGGVLPLQPSLHLVKAVFAGTADGFLRRKTCVRRVLADAAHLQFDVTFLLEALT